MKYTTSDTFLLMDSTIFNDWIRDFSIINSMLYMAGDFVSPCRFVLFFFSCLFFVFFLFLETNIFAFVLIIFLVVGQDGVDQIGHAFQILKTFQVMLLRFQQTQLELNFILVSSFFTFYFAILC